VLIDLVAMEAVKEVVDPRNECEDDEAGTFP
jgi:hypothetical protein